MCRDFVCLYHINTEIIIIIKDTFLIKANSNQLNKLNYDNQFKRFSPARVKVNRLPKNIIINI